MRISVIGSGYVGTVTGAGFAELGNEVLFVDIDEAKVNVLNAARSPIFEPGLEELLIRNRERIRATTDFDELARTELSFICVGTPSTDNGSIDLRYITSAAEEIGGVLKQMETFHLVVVKSTVVPGTTDAVVRVQLESESHKRSGAGSGSDADFGLAMNPEFLREGTAVTDFFNPDRIVLGVKDERSQHLLEALYAPFSCQKLITSIKTSEMIKYVSNAFLATKISFANEVGNVCKQMGIDVYDVFKGVGLDSRINPSFFRAGIGFGGSCFPKDVRALIATAGTLGEATQLLDAVMKVNEAQPLHLIELLKKHIPDLSGRKIGVLGLAFKPDTDDIRESRAIPLVAHLLEAGAEVVAYDPKAMDTFKQLFPQVVYTSPTQVLQTDAVLIVTEWSEFETLDYADKIVIDGRRIEKAQNEAAIYEGVCW